MSRDGRGAAREGAMPLTAKGARIKAAMLREYGREKGERVFYASANAGRIRGVEKRRPLREALTR